MWITWKKQDRDSWFSRVDCQTGVNECAYAFSAWNTVGLKYMLLSLFKIYRRFAWIRNFWDFVQGALVRTDSWPWRCSAISWLALCKKFHTLYYLASELWYHWGYKCKHKRKGGGGVALHCHVLVCLLQWLVSGQREGNSLLFLLRMSKGSPHQWPHDSPSLVSAMFIVVSPTTWALKVAFPGSIFWDLWACQMPRRNAFK